MNSMRSHKGFLLVLIVTTLLRYEGTPVLGQEGEGAMGYGSSPKVWWFWYRESLRGR
jgi:hypothetical protein